MKHYASALGEFLFAFIFGTVEISVLSHFAIDFDRCKWSQWNFWAFYCGFFKVMVHAQKPSTKRNNQ